jgi:hypothetical protein
MGRRDMRLDSSASLAKPAKLGTFDAIPRYEQLHRLAH